MSLEDTPDIQVTKIRLEESLISKIAGYLISGQPVSVKDLAMVASIRAKKYTIEGAKCAISEICEEIISRRLAPENLVFEKLKPMMVTARQLRNGQMLVALEIHK